MSSILFSDVLSQRARQTLVEELVDDVSSEVAPFFYYYYYKTSTFIIYLTPFSIRN